MRRRHRRPLLRAWLLAVAGACLLGLTWYLTLHAGPVDTGQRGGAAAQVQAQIAELNNRLGTMLNAWQQDPQHFALAPWVATLTRPDGSHPNLLLVNPRGIVVEASSQDDVGIDVHDAAWFRSALAYARQNDPRTMVSIAMDNTLQNWRVRVARWLPGSGHSFAGVLLADDDLAQLDTLFRATAKSAGMVPVLDRQSVLYLQAGILTALILLVTGLMLRWDERSSRHAAGFARERGILAAASLELEAARARADAKAAQLEATITGMADGVALLDPDLRLVEWNEHFAELAGVPARLLQPGTTMEEILRAQAEAGEFGSVSVPDEVARRLAVLHNLPDRQTAERTRPDGRIIELRRTRLPDGGLVTLYRDITARRHADSAMRETRALAEAAAAAKSRLIAIVSHEIHTPLRALLDTLKLLGGGAMPPAQQAVLHMAQQSGESLLALIDDILDMSRMEAGEITLRPGVFALAPLLEGVVAMFRSQAGERGIALRLASDPDMPRELFADQARLRQVLVNLVCNAVKFGIPGPVLLLVRQDRDEHGRAVLCLAVRDRGPVIEQAGRERLFRPFSPLELAAGEPLGAGLGLAICRYLVTLMDGEIGCDVWVAEDEHAGNEFWVRLPLAPIPAGARPGAVTSAVPPRLLLPRTRVLLVEDVAANQLITALLLRREGHMVDVAETAEAALQALARQPYDVVLTDIHLPGMHGLELARHIAALPGAAGAVPVVALSANTGPDDRLECERAGIRDVLDKPVASGELVAALGRNVWRGRAAHTVSLQEPPALPAPPLLAQERISELRTHLPPDALRGMVQECLIDLQGRLPALRRALLAGDNNDALAQVHAMIGMAAGYGMSALEMRLRALMAATRGPHANAAAVLLRQLELDLAQSSEALRDALQIEMV